jgi:hypothetical protein
MEGHRVDISTLNENTSTSSDSESEPEEAEAQEDAIEIINDPQPSTSENSVLPKLPFHQLRIVSTN